MKLKKIIIAFLILCTSTSGLTGINSKGVNVKSSLIDNLNISANTWSTSTDNTF